MAEGAGGSVAAAMWLRLICFIWDRRFWAFEKAFTETLFDLKPKSVSSSLFL